MRSDASEPSHAWLSGDQSFDVHGRMYRQISGPNTVLISTSYCIDVVLGPGTAHAGDDANRANLPCGAHTKD